MYLVKPIMIDEGFDFGASIWIVVDLFSLMMLILGAETYLVLNIYSCRCEAITDQFRISWWS